MPTPPRLQVWKVLKPFMPLLFLLALAYLGYTIWRSQSLLTFAA